MLMRGKQNEAEAERIVKYVVLDQHQWRSGKSSSIEPERLISLTER